jgi:hypothetical protein
MGTLPTRRQLEQKREAMRDRLLLMRLQERVSELEIAVRKARGVISHIVGYRDEKGGSDCDPYCPACVLDDVMQGHDA